MTKCASVKKIHTIIILVKRNLELNKWSGIFQLFKKRHALTCPGLYKLIFQSLDISLKWEIDEKVNFETFEPCSRIICRIFVAFWHPIFKREKRSDRANEACCNSCHWLHWGRLCSYKKIVIIKMNKMWYF